METFIAQLVEKTGISEDQAKQVVEYVKENWDKIPGWIGQSGAKDAIKDKLPGGLGGLLG